MPEERLSNFKFTYKNYLCISLNVPNGSVSSLLCARAHAHTHTHIYIMLHVRWIANHETGGNEKEVVE
jgi:hypothetical protein